MSLRIKAVVEKFMKELKDALEADLQDRLMKEREMQSYIEEREREVAEREAAWKAELARREHIVDTNQMLNFSVRDFSRFLKKVIRQCHASDYKFRQRSLATLVYQTKYIQSEIAKQEARLKIERENLEKEKSVLMGTASDNQDGALEITVSGEKYRCLRFSKAKK